MSNRRGFREALREGSENAGLTEQVLGTPLTSNALTNRHKARMAGIMDMAPDRTQPRRTMPSWLRARWDGKPASLPQVFRDWWAAAQNEIGQEIDVEAYLFTEHDVVEMSSDDDIPDDEGMPSYRKFMRLLNLAYDIARRGLDTPIEVANGIIIYGERRWLAFQLLHWFQPDNPKWLQIPAILSSEFDVWKQAVENGQHQELNAVGVARMLAKLIMNIYGEGGFQTFDVTVPAGGADRVFYAQVADGNRYKVPPNRTQDVLIALGLKNPVQLRQYRALLRLRDDVWVRADDEDRTEYFLRNALKLQDQIEDLDTLWKKLGVTVVTRVSTPPPSPGRPTLIDTVLNSSQKSRDAALKLSKNGDPVAREKLKKMAESEVEWWNTLRNSLDL